MWFLYTCTIVTLFATIYTFYYVNVISKREGVIGDIGETGQRGEAGKSGKNTGRENIAYGLILKECEKTVQMMVKK